MAKPKKKKQAQKKQAQNQTKRTQKQAQRKQAQKQKRQQKRQVQQRQEQRRQQRQAQKQQAAKPQKPKKQGKPKLSPEEYKKQRIKNIQNAEEPRMNLIIDTLNLLSDRLADIFANLPSELKIWLPMPSEAGRHYEISDFYAHDYDDEIIKNSLDEIDKFQEHINRAIDELLKIKNRSKFDMELQLEIEAIMNELDALLAEVEKAKVKKQRAISNANLRKMKRQAKKAKENLNKL